LNTTEVCEWCGRPGTTLNASQRSGTGDIEFENPTLCSVCAALIDLGSAGFARTDDQRRWAQTQVEAELARSWQARTSPAL